MRLHILVEGQTKFSLPEEPISEHDFLLLLNGCPQPPKFYSLNGTTLIWNDPEGFTLKPTDELECSFAVKDGRIYPFSCDLKKTDAKKSIIENKLLWDQGYGDDENEYIVPRDGTLRRNPEGVIQFCENGKWYDSDIICKPLEEKKI